MEEREFLALADGELSRLEAALERLMDTGEADFDYELKPGGVIELVFPDDSKIIINRHAAAKEIWVAARSGGFHFKPPGVLGERWCDTRNETALDDLLGRCISDQSGVTVRLG